MACSEAAPMDRATEEATWNIWTAKPTPTLFKSHGPAVKLEEFGLKRSRNSNETISEVSLFDDIFWIIYFGWYISVLDDIFWMISNFSIVGIRIQWRGLEACVQFELLRDLTFPTSSVEPVLLSLLKSNNWSMGALNTKLKRVRFKKQYDVRFADLEMTFGVQVYWHLLLVLPS